MYVMSVLVYSGEEECVVIANSLKVSRELSIE